MNTKLWTRMILSLVAIGTLAIITAGLLWPKNSPLVPGSTTNPSKPQVGLYKGDLAPNFTVTTLDGQKVSLSDYRGKPVMLNFWAVNCEGCRLETPDMQRMYADMQRKKQDFVILGLNMADSSQSVQQFVKDYHITYPIAHDKGAVAATIYALRGTPTSYFIDRQGIIREKAEGAIDEATLSRVIAQISVQ